MSQARAAFRETPESRRVHGVPNDRVGAGRDDRLTLDDLYRRSRIPILSDHQEVNEDSKHGERVAQYREVGRNAGRPAQSVVKNNDDKRRDEDHEADSRDDLLRRRLLGCRPHAQPTSSSSLSLRAI